MARGTKRKASMDDPESTSNNPDPAPKKRAKKESQPSTENSEPAGQAQPKTQTTKSRKPRAPRKSKESASVNGDINEDATPDTTEEASKSKGKEPKGKASKRKASKGKGKALEEEAPKPQLANIAMTPNCMHGIEDHLPQDMKDRFVYFRNPVARNQKTMSQQNLPKLLSTNPNLRFRESLTIHDFEKVKDPNAPPPEGLRIGLLAGLAIKKEILLGEASKFVKMAALPTEVAGTEKPEDYYDDDDPNEVLWVICPCGDEKPNDVTFYVLINQDPNTKICSIAKISDDAFLCYSVLFRVSQASNKDHRSKHWKQAAAERGYKDQDSSREWAYRMKSRKPFLLDPPPAPPEIVKYRLRRALEDSKGTPAYEEKLEAMNKYVEEKVLVDPTAPHCVQEFLRGNKLDNTRPPQ